MLQTYGADALVLPQLIFYPTQQMPANKQCVASQCQKEGSSKTELAPHVTNPHLMPSSVKAGGASASGADVFLSKPAPTMKRLISQAGEATDHESFPGQHASLPILTGQSGGDFAHRHGAVLL
eukprot:scaffold98435_cov33-Prasinocladus_malaysianus.AAC.1